MTATGPGGGAEIEQVLDAFDQVDRALAAATPSAYWQVVADVAATYVPGAEWASVTEKADGRFTTLASTDDRARQADQVQYDLASGPCVDAITDHTVYLPHNLEHDQRWPEFGQRVVREFGVRSMLSFRLNEDGGALLGGLNMYATAAHAFNDRSLLLGEVIATRAAAVANATAAKREVEQIRSALMSNREIGVAMGVLMKTHRINRDQAFDLLRLASQNSNRKLRDIALEVGDTGELEDDGQRA